MREMIRSAGEFSHAPEVIEIPPLGVGNPEAAISYEKQLASGELTPEAVQAAVTFITSSEGMRPLTDSDDGCIDGRPAGSVSFVDRDGKSHTNAITDASEHLRAKVAGGGYITSLAMRVGVGRASGLLENDLADIVSDLSRQHIYAGLHTGEHCHGAATDCGANDKFLPILESGVRYQDAIAANATALMKETGLTVATDALQAPFEHWGRAMGAQYGGESTGASRFAVIEAGLRQAQAAEAPGDKPVAVKKDLRGSHKEDFIIINYREGETFSQAALNDYLAEHVPGVQAHAFVVDVPRLVVLAQALSHGDEEDFQAALFAGVAFQLATAATLTDGTLRTFIVR